MNIFNKGSKKIIPLDEAMRQSIPSFLIIFISFSLGFFTWSMLISHTYLLANERTTNENIKAKRNKDSPLYKFNPFTHRNILLNFNSIMCAPKIKK